MPIVTDAIVLIPGLMSDARVFQHPFQALSMVAPVMVAAPLRGERVEEMASALLDGVPNKAALVGIGLGGCVAIELQRRAPDRVTRLALIATDAQSDTPAQAAAREPMIARARAGRLEEAVAEALPPGHLAPGTKRMEVQALLRIMALDLGEGLFVRQMRALQRRRDYQGVLRRVAVPSLVIGGEADPLSSAKRLQFLAELIPGAQARQIPDAGQLPPLENPVETLRALTDWLSLRT